MSVYGPLFWYFLLFLTIPFCYLKERVKIKCITTITCQIKIFKRCWWTLMCNKTWIFVINWIKVTSIMVDPSYTESWVSQPDVCRCCLSTSGTWDVTSSYVTETGESEVYSDMLQECYGITVRYTSTAHLLCIFIRQKHLLQQYLKKDL